MPMWGYPWSCPSCPSWRGEEGALWAISWDGRRRMGDEGALWANLNFWVRPGKDMRARAVLTMLVRLVPREESLEAGEADRRRLRAKASGVAVPDTGPEPGPERVPVPASACPPSLPLPLPTTIPASRAPRKGITRLMKVDDLGWAEAEGNGEWSPASPASTLCDILIIGEFVRSGE